MHAQALGCVYVHVSVQACVYCTIRGSHGSTLYVIRSVAAQLFA